MCTNDILTVAGALFQHNLASAKVCSVDMACVNLNGYTRPLEKSMCVQKYQQIVFILQELIRLFGDYVTPYRNIGYIYTYLGPDLEK